MKRLRNILIALVAGACLAWAVPAAIAVIAAAPGLATLIRLIKEVGLPVPTAYFALTAFLPAFLIAFGVGYALFRLVAGKRGELFLASTAPWIAMAVYLYSNICSGTAVPCVSLFELAALAVVPIGLLLAALVAKPPSLNMSIDSDPQQHEAAPPQVLVVRSSSRYPS